jgi:hypothetical protein
MTARQKMAINMLRAFVKAHQFPLRTARMTSGLITKTVTTTEIAVPTRVAQPFVFEKHKTDEYQLEV